MNFARETTKRVNQKKGFTDSGVVCGVIIIKKKEDYEINTQRFCCFYRHRFAQIDPETLADRPAKKLCKSLVVEGMTRANKTRQRINYPEHNTVYLFAVDTQENPRSLKSRINIRSK